MYHEKTAPDIFDIFHQRHMNHNEIYRAPCVIKAEAIVVDICQILAAVFEWEKLFQDEDCFDWRLCLNDPEFHSLPGIVTNPAKLAGFSSEKQKLLQTAYALYQRLEYREWYETVEAPLQPSQPDAVAATSEPTETEGLQQLSAILPIARQESEPPQMYPNPYTHRLQWTAGLSNCIDFDPLDKVMCYRYDDTGKNYIIRSVKEVLKSNRVDDNPNFDKHTMWLARD
jgi:hypothetical protein